MEGETRKKRKITDDNEEADEELMGKVERFFALIRNAKHIRDQLLDSDESKKRENNQEKVKTTIWNKPSIDQPKDNNNNIAGKNGGSSSEENHKSGPNNNTNDNNNSKSNFRIAFDLNLFPVSVADLDTTDYRL